MLANVLVSPGVIELREIPTPEPSRGEILIRVKSALTCGTDLKAFRRGHPLIPMPGLFGHEFSGVVAQTGKGAGKFKEGDEIMSVHSAPCRECRYCRKGLYNLCEKIMETKVLGAFAEYILLPSFIVKQNVFRKPASLPFEEAAFLEPLSCVIHGMQTAGIKKDDRALVIGAGPIGLLHVLILKEQGAIVTVADKHRSKLQKAKVLGADRITVSNLPFPTLAREMHRKPSKDSFGFDCVFECTGIPEVWEDSVNYLRRGGTVVLFGGCKSGAEVTYDAGRLHYDEISLKGTFHYTPSDVKRAYMLLSQERICVSELISGRYPLARTQEAFERLSKGVGIKYAIIP